MFNYNKQIKQLDKMMLELKLLEAEIKHLTNETNYLLKTLSSESKASA